MRASKSDFLSFFNRNPGTTAEPDWEFVSYYGYDGQRSVRQLMDIDGGVTDTYDHDAYGNLLARTGSTPNNYLYTGQQWDPDLGMYYLRARYYSPSTGRFWSADSHEGESQDPQSLHKYVYAQNNPVNRIDPSGFASYVGFDTVGWDNFGHVGIITHDPSTGNYTEFDHAHGIVYQRTSTSLQDALAKTDGYGVVFIIPDQYDVALDTARKNYKKHPGGLTMSNNCLTSVLDIFNAAKVPYPNNAPLYPNMWLKAFWDENYGYILLKPKAGAWMMDRLVRNHGPGFNVVPGTGAFYITMDY